jgi:hypothetical protein
MEETIKEIKHLLYAILAHAPAKEDCTPEANEIFQDAQNLRLSIEMWEATSGKITL